MCVCECVGVCVGVCVCKLAFWVFSMLFCLFILLPPLSLSFGRLFFYFFNPFWKFLV